MLALGQGMGPGDAKLATIVGTAAGVFGVAAVRTATLATFAPAGLVTGSLLASRKAHHGQPIAFGPYILAVALIAGPAAC